MIEEWRRGCCCGPTNPAHCAECTTALIDAIDKRASMAIIQCLEDYLLDERPVNER